MNVSEHEQSEAEFSFKNYFIPLTSVKAITWIIIIGITVYGNSIFNGFVADDKIYIINYLPSHVISLAKAFGPSVYNTTGQYRPLPALYFSVLYTLFGSNVFFYHFFQLSLHICCTILLFTLFRKFFSIGIAILSVFVFLIHPLQVESVAYISQTVNELYFLFGIIALLLSLNKRITGRILLMIGLFLFLSLLAKETGFLFFLLILTYSFFYNRKYILKFLFTGLIGFALYCFLRLSVGHVGLDTRQLSPLAMVSLQVRLLSMPAIIFYYIKSFFYPVSLSYDQQWIINSADFTHFYFPIIVDTLFFMIIGFAGFMIYKKQRKNIRLFLFFCVWFISGLAMIMQIYPLDATVADRWFYFPIAGLLGIIGLGLQTFPKWPLNMKKIGIVTGICILLLLSLRTMVRNTNYADSITLFSHDVKVSDNPNLDENLAYELLLANNYQEGLFYLQKSVDIAPNASSLYDLGSLYEQSYNYSKAMYYYSLSLKYVGKTYGEDVVKKNDYDGIARILTIHAKPEIAKDFLVIAVKNYPDDGSYWAYLAIVDYTVGNQDESLMAAEKAKVLLHNSSANLLYFRISHKIPLSLKT
jgi:hypothetical protein